MTSSQLRMDDVREILTTAIRELREEQTKTAANANALSNLIGKYLSTVTGEMKYAASHGRKADISALNPLD